MAPHATVSGSYFGWSGDNVDLVPNVGDLVEVHDGTYDGMFQVRCINSSGNVKPYIYLFNRENKTSHYAAECGCGGHKYIVAPSSYRVCTEATTLPTSSTSSKIMSLIEKAKLTFKKEPERSFIKVGVMDASENLTSEGKDLLLAFLLEKNKDDFKKEVVDPILADIEKECK